MDFITPSPNLIHLSLNGSTPETVLKDLLNKLSLETLENLSVTSEGIEEVYRLDDNLYNQEKFQVTFSSLSTALELDPDDVL